MAEPVGGDDAEVGQREERGGESQGHAHEDLDHAAGHPADDAGADPGASPGADDHRHQERGLDADRRDEERRAEEDAHGIADVQRASE